MLSPGDFAPWFVADGLTRSRYHLDHHGGRRVAVTFLPVMDERATRRVLERMHAEREALQGAECDFLAIVRDDSVIPDFPDESNWRESVFRFDRHNQIAKGYDVPLTEGGRGSAGLITYLLDRRLQVDAVIDTDNPELHAEAILRWATSQPRGSTPVVISDSRHPPVLCIPKVFEPAFVAEMLDWFQAGEKKSTGQMVRRGSELTGIIDPRTKIRTDIFIDERNRRDALQQRLRRRVFPEIDRAFQFKVAYIERYVIACYEGERGGHFARHRDNNAPGMSHRRFALTVNLNEGYEGGFLHFPEYGDTGCRPAVGDAVVFSCSLMHRVSPVMKGTRFAFLSFFYDERTAEEHRNSLKTIDEIVPLIVAE
jgi:predicted 2-oxoglutarate/Fe(II)-dependent dioxygenase YbiX/peroxiredoxin